MRPDPVAEIEVADPIVAPGFKSDKFQSMPMNRTYELVNRNSAVRFPRKTLLA